MEKIVICGCGSHQTVTGKDIIGEVYFPDRSVYVDGNVVNCQACRNNYNIIIFGEQYSSCLHNMDAYLNDPMVVASNITYLSNELHLKVLKNDLVLIRKAINQLSEYTNMCLKKI